MMYLLKWNWSKNETKVIHSINALYHKPSGDCSRVITPEVQPGLKLHLPLATLALTPRACVWWHGKRNVPLPLPRGTVPAIGPGTGREPPPFHRPHILPKEKGIWTILENIEPGVYFGCRFYCRFYGFISKKLRPVRPKDYFYGLLATGLYWKRYGLPLWKGDQ